MIAKFMWKHFHKQLINYYIHSQAKPIGLSELQLCHTDTTGKRYYRFPANMTLPMERFGKMQEYIMWMSSGVSGEELDLLLKQAEKALNDGIANTGNAAKIGAIFEQIKDRRNLVIHTELLYNFMAVQWVREDENPVKFDNDIHIEKVNQLKTDNEVNPYFFFQNQELRQLSHLWKMSKKEWIAYWNESKLQQKVLQESLKIYQ